MQVPTRQSDKEPREGIDPHITQGKYDELKASLEGILKSRPALAKHMQIQAQDGDFSENAGYQQAKSKLRGLNSSILRIENILKHAIIIEHNSDCSVVQLGHTVTFEVNGKEKSYKILGSLESDPENRIISHESPIGSILIGKRVGDVAINKIDDREILYKILKIE